MYGENFNEGSIPVRSVGASAAYQNFGDKISLKRENIKSWFKWGQIEDFTPKMKGKKGISP